MSGSCGDGEAILSPLDEDSSVESENNTSAGCESQSYYMNNSANDNDVEGMFLYQACTTKWKPSNLKKFNFKRTHMI